MGFNSKRFISTRYFSSTLFIHTSLPHSLLPTIPHKEVCGRIKVGVEEKKKTQGVRRDLAHFYGVFIHHFFFFSFSLHFRWCVFLGGRKLDEKENWRLVTKYFAGNTISWME